MARFLAHWRPSDSEPKPDLDAAMIRGMNAMCAFVSAPLEQRQIHTLDNQLSIHVAERVSELTHVYAKSPVGLSVIVDGAPQLRDRILTAQEFLHHVQLDGVQALASELDGGWTAIIADTANNALHVVRDRIGLKPVYYADLPNGITVASTAGAIVRSGLASSDFNLAVLGRYFTCNYRAVYGRPETFFKDVRLLGPGEILSIKEGSIKSFKYWDFNANANLFSPNTADLSAEYRHALDEMIRCFLKPRQSDRIAVSLSGGIDSGTIAGALHRHTKEKFDAVSMTYTEATDFDEGDLIKDSVTQNIATWHDIKVDWQVMYGELPGLYGRFDQPLATISIYGYDYLYRAGAELGYNTFFTGSGGDYIQAGNYTNYLYYLADLKSSGNPDLYQHELEHWIHHHSTAQYPKSEETANQFFAAAVDLTKPGALKSQNLQLLDGIASKDLRQVNTDWGGAMVGSYGSFLRSYTVQEYWYEAVAPGSGAEDIMDWTYGTAMTSPFFQRAIIDMGWSIPPDHKIRDGVNKFLARKALRGIVPDTILNRVDKSGFNAPIDVWVRGPLRDQFIDIFQSRSFRERGIYDLQKFNSLVDEHMSGDKNHMMLLWQAYNGEQWLRSWCDKRC